MSRRLTYAGGLVLILVAYAATGIYTVAENEVGVVRRFGRFDPPLREPGLHFGLPWGLDRVDRVKPREVKRLTVGMGSTADRLLGAPATSPTSLFLTGDQNLVVIQAIVQYSIADPVRYLFRAGNAEAALRQLVTTSLSEALARKQIDHVLTTGKQELAAEVLSLVAERAERLGLGVSIRAVTLPVVEAPPEVRDAFDNVNAARAEAETMVMEAGRYADRVRYEARAQANQKLAVARAEAAEIRNAAVAEVTRFNRLLYEYRRQPELVANRLFFQTISEVLPVIRRKIVVGGEDAVGLGIVQPLDEEKQGMEQTP